jgi:calcineurin-like phosphoesterase family protein
VACLGGEKRRLGKGSLDKCKESRQKSFFGSEELYVSCRVKFVVFIVGHLPQRIAVKA